jgi:hypothetical protein
MNRNSEPRGSGVSCDGVYPLLPVARRSSREKLPFATETVQEKAKKFFHSRMRVGETRQQDEGTPRTVSCGAVWPKHGASFILSFCSTRSPESGAVESNAEADIPTQSPPPCQGARVPAAHEDEERTGRAVAPPRQGTQARLGEPRLPRLAPSPNERSPAAAGLPYKEARTESIRDQRTSHRWNQQRGLGTPSPRMRL